MTLHNASEYHRQARQQLTQATAPKRLVLIHTAVALGSTVFIYLMGYLFNLLIADTGGLSGMGTRSILSTAQTMLETAVTMALPFWQVGLFFLALRWARNQSAQTSNLLQGFRHFGPVLIFRLLYGVVFGILGFLLVYPCAAIFLMTPFSAPFLEAFAPLFDPSATAQEIEAMLTPEQMLGAMDTMIPMFILFGIAFLLVAIPVFYRLRLGEFALMDGLSGGHALLSSFRATKKNWLPLVTLDLHFWWYYVLQVVCLIFANGNWLLPLLGVNLPLSEDARFFLFYGLGTALQILLLWQFQGQVLTSFALLYDDLCLPKTELILEEV